MRWHKISRAKWSTFLSSLIFSQEIHSVSIAKTCKCIPRETPPQHYFRESIIIFVKICIIPENSRVSIEEKEMMMMNMMRVNEDEGENIHDIQSWLKRQINIRLSEQETRYELTIFCLRQSFVFLFFFFLKLICIFFNNMNFLTLSVILLFRRQTRGTDRNEKVWILIIKTVYMMMMGKWV